MDDAIAQLVAVLAQLGLPGVVIAVLLYRDNQHTKRNEALTDKLIEQGQKSIEAIAASTASNQSLQQTIMLARSNAAG
jgi:hypothetical protein